MKEVFREGEKKIHRYTVKVEDIAAFESGVVHNVCSTFALAREIEWATRLFVLEMKEEDEEGIGTSLEIRHKNPVFVGETLTITASFDFLVDGELLCTVKAMVGSRLIAVGKTGQRIIPVDKLKTRFEELRSKNDG